MSVDTRRTNPRMTLPWTAAASWAATRPGIFDRSLTIWLCVTSEFHSPRLCELDAATFLGREPRKAKNDKPSKEWLTTRCRCKIRSVRDASFLRSGKVRRRLCLHQLKGLILAQNERWRRGLGMQVAREPARGTAAKGTVMCRSSALRPGIAAGNCR